jgi:hypothetical protein
MTAVLSKAAALGADSRSDSRAGLAGLSLAGVAAELPLKKKASTRPLVLPSPPALLPFKEELFGENISAWERELPKCGDKKTLEECAKKVASNEALIAALKASKDPLVLLLKFLSDEKIPPGTSQLSNLISAINRSSSEVKLGSVNLPIRSYLNVRAALTDPKGEAAFREISATVRDRGERLILFARYLKKAGVEVSHLGHIYSALPEEIKGQVAKVNLPLKVAEQIRDLCRTDECAGILKGHKGSDGGAKLIHLAKYFARSGARTDNLGSLYSALPEEIKAQVAHVNLPLKVAEQIEELCGTLECAQLLKELEGSDGGTKLIHLAKYFARSGARTENLSHIYSALPEEIKGQVVQVSLPLKVAEQIRKLCGTEECAQILRELEGSDAGLKLIHLARYFADRGARTDNLGHIYSALPEEIKSQVAHVNLSLKVAEKIRELCGTDECAGILRDLQGSEGTAKLIHLAKYFAGKGAHTDNLGSIYSALPEEIRAQVAYVNLPLKVAEKIRELCRTDECARVLKEHEGSDGGLKLIHLAKYFARSGARTDNLGQIYSALPEEIKGKVAYVGFPLKVASTIRETAASPEIQAMLEDKSFRDLSSRRKRDSFIGLMQLKCKESARHGAQIFEALPEQLSPSIRKKDLVPHLLTLKVGNETLYFDSASERVIGQLLLRYGLVSSLIEGENLHVVTNDKRGSIDFLVRGVLIEFHPLSRMDKRNGLNLTQSHERKFDNIDEIPDGASDVVFISKLKEFYTLITSHPNLKPALELSRPGLSREDFTRDVLELWHSGEE